MHLIRSRLPEHHASPPAAAEGGQEMTGVRPCFHHMDHDAKSSYCVHMRTTFPSRDAAYLLDEMDARIV